MSEELPLTVPPEFARLLQAALEAGEYPSADAALADALAVWARRHEDAAENLAWVRARIRRARLDPTPLLTEEEVDRRMDAFFAAVDKADDEAA